MNTTFADNQSLGRPVGFCEGVQPRDGPFIFALAFEVLADPEQPADRRPAGLPGARAAAAVSARVRAGAR